MHLTIWLRAPGTEELGHVYAKSKFLHTEIFLSIMRYLYVIGRFCLSVCLSVTKNDHFAQQSQIKFLSGSNFFFLTM